MKPIKLLFLLLGLSLQVTAQEDFHSPPGEGDLLGIETTLKLNDDVETILQHHSRYRGQFHLNSEQSDQMLQIGLLQNARDEISGTLIEGYVDCNSKEKQNGGIGVDPNDERLVRRDRKTDREFRISLMVKGGIGSTDMRRTPYSQASFNSSLNNKVRSMDSDLNGMGLKEAHEYLMKNGGEGRSSLETKLSEEAFDSLVRHRIINADPTDRMSIYQEAGKHLSFDRQIQFIAKLGGDMLGNYDSDRANMAMSADTEVKCDNILSGLSGSASVGVCRDMVLCQAKILEGMGNKGNVYALTYSSPGSYHTTLVASDPDKPTNVHKVNYSSIETEGERGGIAALSQSQIPDVGITYRIWKPDGKMVSSLPNEMGLVLNEVTGGKNQEDFDPFIRDDYHLISAKAKWRGIHGNLFAGTLTSGDRIFGVATHLDWKGRSGNDQSPIELKNKGKVGLAYNNRSIETNSIEGDDKKDYNVNQLYFTLQEEVSLPLRFSPDVQIEPFTSGRLAGTAVHTEGEKPWTGDGDLTVDIGARANINLNEGNTRVVASVKSQHTPGLGNLSALAGSNVIVAKNHTTFEGEVQQDINDEVTLFANTVFAMRDYGDTAKVGSGVLLKAKKHETRIYTSYQTPTGGLVQGWQPGGASRSFSANIDEKIFDIGKKANIGISTQFRYDVDTKAHMFYSGAAVHW